MKTANQILSVIKSKLKKVCSEKTGSFLARCPAHKDDKSSLSVSIGKHKDRVVLFCHAGCSFETVLERLGMNQTDLYVKRGKKEIVAIYDYFDESGKLKHQTVRYNNKEFSQRHPDGKGDWIWNLQGIQPVLYRLPELIAAPNEVIYVVEGEKDVDRLLNIGILATTNPMGAGKWRSGYSETLKGRNVALIADNDESGHKHADTVAQSLMNIASVKIVNLPGLPNKGDVSDWLNGDGTAEKLRQLTKKTPKFKLKTLKTPEARLIEAITEGTVEAAFKAVPILARLDTAGYGVAKSQLKDNCPKLNLCDLVKAVKDEQRKMRDDKTMSRPVRSKGPPAPPATLDDIIQAFKKYLFFTDDSAIKISLATVVANFMKGDPVWLMVVAPPSVGKTEIVEPIGGLWEARIISTITEAGLLPATPARDRSKTANDGLLRELGDFGILILKDFGSILSMNMESRAPVLAALREIYDGHWSRIVGTDGGRVIEWSGKIGVIAATTDSIDRHHGVMATLGERFVFYRISTREEEERADFALQSIGNETDLRSEAMKKVRGLIDNLDIKDKQVKLSAAERKRINALARFTAHCRSPSGRDPRTHEMIMKPGTEGPTRLAKIFALLYTALQILKIPSAESWRLLQRMANNSMPKIRFECLNAILSAKRDLVGSAILSTREIATEISLPTKTVERALYDLVSHNVLVRSKKAEHDNAPNFWGLSEWAEKTREECS